METSVSSTSAAARHPADPDPVPSTKASAAYALSVIAVLTAPMIGGVIPALLAMRMAKQADAEIAHSRGFLLGAAKSRQARRFSIIALGVAGFVVAAWLVWWAFRVAARAGGA
ncbi:hypothetical protein FB566_3640 [Stackebrandtia endophytica]|uniref:Uncharacterized protein n=1 Tax=Stackebrandtia endophytica TaxID=1496996 RepID=A0A543AZP9_9ACTN|nr:hypothetical protein [Stackebrandtia endophytica]TQL78063.1 hypothetical protein FB566_3640 [Stackebrandtia endophytica]